MLSCATTLFMLCQHCLYWPFGSGSTSPIPLECLEQSLITIYSCIYPLDKKEQVSLFWHLSNSGGTYKGCLEASKVHLCNSLLFVRHLLHREERSIGSQGEVDMGEAVKACLIN